MSKFYKIEDFPKDFYYKNFKLSEKGYNKIMRIQRILTDYDILILDFHYSKDYFNKEYLHIKTCYNKKTDNFLFPYFFISEQIANSIIYDLRKEVINND